MSYGKYDELFQLIDEIKTKLTVKSVLTSSEAKKQFKELMLNACHISDYLTKLRGPKDPEYVEKRVVVDNALLALTDIHSIDKQIYTSLCRHTGFSDRQINRVSAELSKKKSAEKKIIPILFQSTFNNIPLLQNPEIKKYFSAHEYIQTENIFDSFIRHIFSSEGTDAVFLEQMARLTIYQKQRFLEDIQSNPELKSAYNKFLNNKELSETEKNKCFSIVKMNCLRMMAETPISFKSMGSVSFAGMHLPTDVEINDSYWKGASPACWADAWGVTNKHYSGPRI